MARCDCEGLIEQRPVFAPLLFCVNFDFHNGLS